MRIEVARESFQEGGLDYILKEVTKANCEVRAWVYTELPSLLTPIASSGDSQNYPRFWHVTREGRRTYIIYSQLQFITEKGYRLK